MQRSGAENENKKKQQENFKTRRHARSCCARTRKRRSRTHSHKEHRFTFTFILFFAFVLLDQKRSALLIIYKIESLIPPLSSLPSSPSSPIIHLRNHPRRLKSIRLAQHSQHQKQKEEDNCQGGRIEKDLRTMEEGEGSISEVGDVEIQGKRNSKKGIGCDQGHEGGTEEEGEEEVVQDGGKEEEGEEGIAVDVESIPPLHLLLHAM